MDGLEWVRQLESHGIRLEEQLKEWEELFNRKPFLGTRVRTLPNGDLCFEVSGDLSWKFFFRGLGPEGRTARIPLDLLIDPSEYPEEFPEELSRDHPLYSRVIQPLVNRQVLGIYPVDRGFISGLLQAGPPGISESHHPAWPIYRVVKDWLELLAKVHESEEPPWFLADLSGKYSGDLSPSAILQLPLMILGERLKILRSPSRWYRKKRPSGHRVLSLPLTALEVEVDERSPLGRR